MRTLHAMIKFNVQCQRVKYKLTPLTSTNDEKTPRKSFFCFLFISKPFVSNSDSMRVSFIVSFDFFCYCIPFYLFIFFVAIETNHWRIQRIIQHSNKTPTGTFKWIPGKWIKCAHQTISKGRERERKKKNGRIIWRLRRMDFIAI